MIGGAKGIGIGIDFGIPNQYCRATSKPYIEKDVLDSLRVVASAYGKSNNDSDRAIIKNLVDPDNPFIISNAAFKLNSGFGKYEEDFTDWRIYPNIKVTDSVVTTDGNFKSSWFIYKHSSESKINEMNIKVSGIPKGGKILYFYISDETANLPILYTIPKDGIYHLPESKINNNRASVGFTVESSYDWNNIRIEQIPSFEGAFVTDGVDDLITSTKTVQDMLGESNECTVLSMMCQIGDTIESFNRNNWLLTPTSYLESRVEKEKTGKTGIYGYTSTDINNGQISNINSILGDKNDYTANSKIESTGLDYFSVEGFQNEGIWYTSSVAWYWTIIANKVLTTDQINQVIAYFNLDRTLKPDILCDVKKQGITNENHAEFGDRLIDFSGNGRDIQLNNIAWKGDSGIGKYSADFESFDCAVGISQKQHNKATMSLNSRLCNHTAIEVDEMKVNIIGNITELIYWYIANPDDTTRSEIRLTSGINTLPKSYAKDDGQTYNIGFAYISGDSEITIEQIPSHAGALCLDGVNDFGKVTGMPVYKDYTFIIDYERISYASSERWVAGVVSKSHVANQGAFILMTANTTVEPGKQAYSFGGVTSFNRDDFTRALVYQSKYKCGDVDLTVGEGVDSNTLWLGTFRDNDQRSFNGAIYSLMSFPYSMSEFLIERQLKKHKLGTLYPDMVEWRPIYTSNVNDYTVAKTAYFGEAGQFDLALGSHYSIGTRIRIYVKPNGAADEVTSIKVNGVELTYDYVDSNHGYAFNGTLSDKSPQKINITIDEYIRFEDIVQPYPLFFEFTDENNNLISWGGKAKVGSTITRTKGVNYANLLEGLFTITNPRLNGVALASAKHIVEKSMVFTCTATYTFDNNEPKCILSPRLLRIPNSSYKILGYIPDISGHGNNGVIHNSAYAEGSGVNEDGSYQFDGVDDFVTIPTTGGGKQVFMKINNNDTRLGRMLYDQRSPSYGGLYSDFAIYTVLDDDTNNTNIAYQARLVGNTYIDGILNTNITCSDLLGVLQNITITCDIVAPNNGVVPYIGTGGIDKNIYGKLALYDFMLFDEISTDDKIKELNEYVGIEGDVWGILTQLSNSTLISNETLIKNE